MRREPYLNQRYKPLKKLTSGPYAEVLKAQDTLKDRPVLLKSHLPSALQNWKQLQLIERETRILSQINHIEIPGFVDFFTTGPEGNQTLHLVTYWVNGVTLEEKIAAGWQPGTDEIMNIAVRILELLIYIHAFNPPLIHRDIKPSNLMINEWGRIYLIDFGGAQEAIHAYGTGGSTIVGTVGYMAPEHIQGRAIPSSDLFSVGITLLKLFQGKKPLPPEHAQQLYILREKISSDTLYQWFQLMIAPDHHQRYHSPEEALRDLDRIYQRDYTQKELFYPRNHKAQIPEIIHSLTLTQRDEQSQALSPGSLLEGRYEIERLLGSGTHSNVYKAVTLVHQQTVVIKELRIERVSEWKNIELFEREIEIQKQLYHPGIPRFIDAFQIKEEGTLSWFLVTEYVAEQTLEDKLQAGWRPTTEKIWHIALKVLDILQYLHQHDPPWIHRDIKPSNLMIGPEKNVYLIDFGAVQNRLWSEGGGGSTIIGTFGYMAPEQFSGEAFIQSDLYGLGATLVRALSNKHPIEIPLEISGLNFTPFVKCEPFYIHWLQHLLNPLPEKRFQSAKAARDLLQDALNKGETARQWSLRQQRNAIPVNTSTATVARLPLKIEPKDIAELFLGTQLQVTAKKQEVVLQSHDTKLSKSWQYFEQSLLPDTSSLSSDSVVRYRLKEFLSSENAASSLKVIPMALLWTGFLLQSFGVLIPVLTMLGFLAGIIIAVMVGLKVLRYGSGKQEARRLSKNVYQRQQQGELLPFNTGTHVFDKQLSAGHRLRDNALHLSLEGIRLRAEKEHFFKWSEIESIAFQLALSDYPHWSELMDNRFYELNLSSQGQKHRFLLALEPEDILLLESAFQRLLAHYEKESPRV